MLTYEALPLCDRLRLREIPCQQVGASEAFIKSGPPLSLLPTTNNATIHPCYLNKPRSELLEGNLPPKVSL